MTGFWCHILEALTANFFLAVLLIIFNEWLFPKRNISGEWEVNQTYEKTSYNKYKGIQIQYKFNLLQQGDVITGHGEKISDINSDRGLYVFEREKRVHLEINGYYERNFFKKNRIYLNVVESGRKRETSQSFKLIFGKKSELKGKFVTTAADAAGPITMSMNELVL